LYPSHDATVRGRLLNYGSFALAAATMGLAAVRRPAVAFVYHPPPTVGLASLVPHVLSSAPFLNHIADMWPESAMETGRFKGHRSGRWIEAMIHRWCDLMYRKAAALTVVTPGYKRMVMERGIPADKIHVAYNWVDEETFRPMPRDP